MENEQISKKELLEMTGISYGQLYRWKRKELIPEDWFIKKASFTGQETFFPKDKILARIDKIKNMKEDLQLDDIAEVFSPTSVDISLNKEDLVKLSVASQPTMDLFLENMGEQAEYNFKTIISVFILNKILQSGNINRDEGKIVLKIIIDNLDKIDGKNYDLILIRKMGVFTCFLIANSSEFYFESNTKIVDRININSCIEELKINLNL